MRYVNLIRLKRAAYGILLLMIFLIQSSYRYQFSVFGVKPDLVPFLIAAIALFEGPACAAAYGFFAGLLLDYTLPGLDGFNPFFYIAAGVLIGFAAEKYFRRNIFSSVLLGMAAALSRNLLKFFFYYMLILRASFFSGMRIIFSELIVSALISPLVYLAVKRLYGRFTEED